MLCLLTLTIPSKPMVRLDFGASGSQSTLATGGLQLLYSGAVSILDVTTTIRDIEATNNTGASLHELRSGLCRKSSLVIGLLSNVSWTHFLVSQGCLVEASLLDTCHKVCCLAASCPQRLLVFTTMSHWVRSLHFAPH
jgi:hypothetical protein